MPRQNIFELLASKYNVVKEMNKIAKLFSMIQITARNPFNFQVTQFGIEGIFETCCFTTWKQRGAYVSCTELKEDLSLPKQFSEDIDEMVQGLEYYINVLNMLEKILGIRSNINYSCPPAYTMLLKNIDILLEHINYEKLEFPDEEKVILVPTNPAATAVAEISSKDTAFAILKYHHASLKGNLAEKKKLLLSIANEYEPLLAKPIAGFKEYFDKATGLLNNLNLRHNNKTGKHKIDAIANMPPEEMENWYDDLYQLLLFCVLIKDNTVRKEKAANLLKTIKTVKQ